MPMTNLWGDVFLLHSSLILFLKRLLKRFNQLVRIMCVCVLCECRCSWRLEEGNHFPGAGVMGHELASMDAEKQTL